MLYRDLVTRSFRPSQVPPEQRGDADRLASALARAGKSAADLVRYLGLSDGAISQWINGTRRIPEKRLLEIAKFLKVRPEDISPAIARELARKVRLVHSLQTPGKRGSSSELQFVQTPPAQQARIRGIATMSVAASWQWTDMLPAEGSVPWNRPGCYALRVMGDAMHPRYKSGEYLIIREDGPIDSDHDVLVVLKDGTAMIRELASLRDGQVRLNGPAGNRTTVAESKVEFIHRIVGRSDASEVDT